MDLRTAAVVWMTPNVPNGGRTASHAIVKGRTLTREDGTKVQLGLEHQAQTWATPTARMHKGGGQAVTRADGKSRLDMLDWQAEAWPTPMAGSAGTETYNAAGNSDFSRKAEELAKGVRAFAMTDLSLPDRPTPSGEKSSETRRRLNPLFVEWLMGWPEGLSGFDTAGTASCHSPQPSPGCDCMDCWLSSQRAMLSDLLTITPPAQGALF